MLQRIAMKSRELRIRALVEIIFWAFLFAAFLWEAYGSYFCTESGRISAVLQALRISFILTVWDFVASALGLLAAHPLRNSTSAKIICLLVSAVIGGIGYVCAVFIFAPGGSEELIFGRVLDCSCFFTEGYGMMFPFTWASLLVAATVIRELLTRRILTHSQSGI